MTAARQHDPETLKRLQSAPGIGPVLSLVLLYEIHDIHRFPRVQDVASYCRVVKCAHESGGKRYGTSGHNIGNVHLKWAFSEAAVLFLRRRGRSVCCHLCLGADTPSISVWCSDVACTCIGK
jgi:transposase